MAELNGSISPRSLVNKNIHRRNGATYTNHFLWSGCYPHHPTRCASTIVDCDERRVLLVPEYGLRQYCAYESPSLNSWISLTWIESSIWQSNGRCNTYCKDSHPFGVILGSNCWCSDYIPAEQEDTSECNDACDGYPSEDCGNASKNLYIYVRLDSDAAIKGTQGTSQPTSSSVSPSSSAIPVASSEAPSSSEVKTVSTLLFLASASNGYTAKSTLSPLSFTRLCLSVHSVSCVLF